MILIYKGPHGMSFDFIINDLCIRNEKYFNSTMNTQVFKIKKETIDYLKYCALIKYE